MDAQEILRNQDDFTIVDNKKSYHSVLREDHRDFQVRINAVRIKLKSFVERATA